MAYRVLEERFATNDRALAEGEPLGKIKVLVSPKGAVLGCQIVGDHAGELIHEWVAAVNGGVKLSTLAGAIHAYPTLSEISKRVAGSISRSGSSATAPGACSSSSSTSRGAPVRCRRSAGSEKGRGGKPAENGEEREGSLLQRIPTRKLRRWIRSRHPASQRYRLAPRGNDDAPGERRFPLQPVLSALPPERRAEPDRGHVPKNDGCCRGVRRARRTSVIDLTGGAPELVPGIEGFLERLAPLAPRILFRANLTALAERADLVSLLARLRVVVVASFPSLSASETDSRARHRRIRNKRRERPLRMLNTVGYGQEGSGLELDLVSNPGGTFLPPEQATAETQFHRELARAWGITFNHLYTLANMPLGRFRAWLTTSGNLEAYLRQLAGSFNPCTVGGLMCRNLISVSWDGVLYDCDFNLARGLPLGGVRTHVSSAEGAPPPGAAMRHRRPLLRLHGGIGLYVRRDDRGLGRAACRAVQTCRSEDVTGEGVARRGGLQRVSGARPMEVRSDRTPQPERPAPWKRDPPRADGELQWRLVPKIIFFFSPATPCPDKPRRG